MNELQFDDDFMAALDRREGNPRWSQIDSSAQYVAEKLNVGQPAHLMFVCTHNSRRSQFAHVWAETWARKLGLEGVYCYSGGTEVTACNQRTVAALERFGFNVTSNGGDNPDYSVKFSDDHPAVTCNSSLFSSAKISNFAAMMCCADVDEKCPVVVGAEIRIPWHYDDPKAADDTSEEKIRYYERCRQIGKDMMLLMHEVLDRRTPRSVPVY